MSKFKVGDRVTHEYLGAGIVSGRNPEWNGRENCRVTFDDGEDHDCFFTELSPAPEPRYYTGKVFAVRQKLGSACESVLKRNGHVFEIKDGMMTENVNVFDMHNGNPVKSFSDFCDQWFLTEWAEVKE